ncbi:MAG TPA: hypothetical protein VMU45_09690 [Candidatus Eisenbacteria bacterium]|nr:hypothetical protein [Candidatus Eisenbacteria bacterium]
MGAIEDVRTLLQDEVAPDLKSLTVRVEDAEKPIAALEQRMDARFDKLERDSEKRHNELVSYLSLEARMNKLERAIEPSGKQGQ